MKGNSQIYLGKILGKPADHGDNATGGNRYIPVTDIQPLRIVNQLQKLGQIQIIVKGFYSYHAGKSGYR